MPYKGEETSVVIVLPYQIDGLDSLIDKLKDTGAFSNSKPQMVVIILN